MSAGQRNVCQRGASTPMNSLRKRLFDVLLIILSLPVTAPLFAGIAAIIKLFSRGPVLYRQARIGYLEKEFTCLKFRTMRTDVNTHVHETYFKDLMGSQKPMIKLDAYGDTRLIRFGGFLRASGLDELPQLLNVLMGQMSLVGPRPCTPNEYKDYLPWQKERFKAIPGLTGLWQVSGKNRTTFNQMIQLDIKYAHRQSLGLDLLIVLRTLPVLIRQIIELVKNKLCRSSSKRKNAESTHSGTEPSTQSLPAGKPVSVMAISDAEKYRETTT
jgi:exopolysaccharide production protein ExoY